MVRYAFRVAWYAGLLVLSAVAFYLGLGSPIVSASVVVTSIGYLPLSITFFFLFRSRLAQWVAGGRVHTPSSFLRYLPGLALVAVGLSLLGVELSSVALTSVGLTLAFAIADALLAWYEQPHEPLDAKSAPR